MFSLFVTWAAQQVGVPAEPEAYRFLGIFGSKIEAAVVAVLMSMAGLLAAKAWKIKHYNPQRRADDTWRKEMKADLDRELQAFKQQIATVEGLSRNNTARIEDVAELAQKAAEKAEVLDEKVEEVKEYLHEVSHGLRNEMQSLVRVVGNVEGAMNVLGRNVNESMNTLVQTVRDLRR